jgi:DNA-binding response OmpR family regulator
MKDRETVLAVDDEPKILELVKSYLEMNGYNALCAKNGSEGITLFEREAEHVYAAYLEKKAGEKEK